MFGIINSTLKERVEKREPTKLYRAKGINRKTRRIELGNILRQKPKKESKDDKPVIKKARNMVPARGRLPAIPQRTSPFSAIRNLFKRGNA